MMMFVGVIKLCAVGGKLNSQTGELAE